MRTVSNITRSNLEKRKQRKALLHIPVILVLVFSRSRNILEQQTGELQSEDTLYFKMQKFIYWI